MININKILSNVLAIASICIISQSRAMADECLSYLPYLREIQTSASAAANNATSATTYGSMIRDYKQSAESSNNKAAINALGYGDGSASSNKNRNDIDYHSAVVMSDSNSANQSSHWLQNYSNKIASSSTALISQCFNQRGIDYSFTVGGDGVTIIIKATFRTPDTRIPSVRVNDVVTGVNVKCEDEKFTEIDAGDVVLRCTRNNPKGDTIIISTTYGGGNAVFFVPDVRPRFRESIKSLDLTWCGGPSCASDMSRQVAWAPPSIQPLSCSLFDLRELGLLREGEILIRDQTFPLELLQTVKGNWGDIHQDTPQSKPLEDSNTAISLCGTRKEPFDDWPNQYFHVRTQVRYLERIFYQD